MKSLFCKSLTGSYVFLSTPIVSHYQGVFFMLRDELELYKVFDDISLDKDLVDVKYNSLSFKRMFSDSCFDEFEFLDSSTLSYKVRGFEGFISFNLDFRRVHDFCDKGRIFKIEKFDGGIKIFFDKYSDDSLLELVESRSLVILGDNIDFEYSENWRSKNYVYDLERKTHGFFYVNEGLKIKCNGSVDLRFVFDEPVVNKKIKKISLRSDLDKSFFAVNNLRYSDKFDGLFAGYPWFYQFWSRDELISLSPYIIKKNKSFVKSVLFRHLNRIKEGLVLNRYPESELGSVDSLGWLCFRIEQSISFFTNKELNFIRNKILKSVEDLSPRIKNGLLYNFGNETWMDTSNENDFREGFRVEIQSLFIVVYRLLFLIDKKLGLKSDMKTKYEDVKVKVKSFLFKDFLRDGFNKKLSNTVRPNVFLSYYLTPELLSKKEWEVSFDKVIDECWLDWGGFSSISKNHFLFKEEYTGITNESYHRGDSWFFLNNIAGLCMVRLNKKKYAKYISKIKSASLFEMKSSGAIGYCAEISCAKSLRSLGCFNQAWSAATLFEFLYEN